MKNTTVRFKIPVDCSAYFNKSNGQLKSKIYYDCGMIMLPDNYTEKGKPTRLVISCHGAGGTVTTNDSQVEVQALTQYLLANGYAVMDVNGLPFDFASEYGINVKNNVGSPIAIQSYVKAYNYCIENFNLYKEVFVHGASMGGISSTNLVLSNKVPVIAQSGFCPVLDTYNQIFLNPWSNGLPKTALIKFYFLDKNKNGEYEHNEDKILGYNPMGRCYKKGDKECLDYPVPVKFWHCADDTTVCIDTTKRFVNAVNNVENKAILCILPSGGHEPQLYGDYIEKPSGNVTYKNQTLQITKAVEEVYLWFEKFN